MDEIEYARRRHGIDARIGTWTHHWRSAWAAVWLEAWPKNLPPRSWATSRAPWPGATYDRELIESSWQMLQETLEAAAWELGREGGPLCRRPVELLFDELLPDLPLSCNDWLEHEMATIAVDILGKQPGTRGAN